MMQGTHSFGEELRYCDVNGIRISETVIPRALNLPEHTHEPGQICFVLEGEYRESLGERTHLLRPGSIQLHAPGQCHANSFSSEEETLTLLISIEPKRWIELSRRGPLQLTPRLSDLAEETRRELRDGSESSQTALEGLTLLLMSTISRAPMGIKSTEPSWLSDAEAHIESRYHSAVSLASVAAAVGVHRATLAAAFRRFRSTSVGERIRDVRVRHACTLIEAGVALDEIAVSTGFADQAHFGRVFKRIMGHTPGDARARKR